MDNNIGYAIRLVKAKGERVSCWFIWDGHNINDPIRLNF